MKTESRTYYFIISPEHKIWNGQIYTEDPSYILYGLVKQASEMLIDAQIIKDPDLRAKRVKARARSLNRYKQFTIKEMTV